jgi:hypothetical protein
MTCPYVNGIELERLWLMLGRIGSLSCFIELVSIASLGCLTVIMQSKTIRSAMASMTSEV